MTSCPHSERRVCRNVSVIQYGGRLTTGVKFVGGKDWIMIPVEEESTKYARLVYCPKCLTILDGELEPRE